jgi:membrane-bound metal-dependent hydrolase YbcI (DUF457 family)
MQQPSPATTVLKLIKLKIDLLHSPGSRTPLVYPRHDERSCVLPRYNILPIICRCPYVVVAFVVIYVQLRAYFR